MIAETDRAYIAGLFDGEGSIYYAKRAEKKKKHNGKGYRTSMSQRISMEITMTDESVIRWVHEILTPNIFLIYLSYYKSTASPITGLYLVLPSSLNALNNCFLGLSDT